jgi:hypothetical protein
LSPHSHIGDNISGTYAVDLDIVLTPLVAQGFCELPKGPLGSRVSRNCDTTLESEERANVYNLPLPPRNHVAAGGLGKEPDGLEVDV